MLVRQADTIQFVLFRIKRLYLPVLFEVLGGLNKVNSSFEKKSKATNNTTSNRHNVALKSDQPTPYRSTPPTEIFER